jgi:hypothetical protein
MGSHDKPMIKTNGMMIDLRLLTCSESMGANNNVSTFAKLGRLDR